MYKIKSIVMIINSSLKKNRTFFLILSLLYLCLLLNSSINSFLDQLCFQRELVSNKQKLASLKRKVEFLKREVAYLKQDFESVRQEPASNKQELASLKQDFESVRQELASDKQELASLKQEYKSLRQEYVYLDIYPWPLVLSKLIILHH